MIKTDYSKIKDLFLAYPKGFDKESNALSDFFEKLIELVPEEIHLYIIVNNEKASDRIKYLYPSKNIDVVIIKNFGEIWLRDILGFNTEENKIIKTLYKPDYYKNIYTKSYLKLIDAQTREIIDRTIGKRIIDMPLIMDGGNLVTNGDIGILTDKVFRDNNEKSENEIKEILKEYLGIRPVIIKTSKYDKLGHSDGYVSFLSQKEICLAQYPAMKSLQQDTAFLKTLESILKEEGLEVAKIYDRPVIEKTHSPYNDSADFLYSAKGNYINFMHLNELILLPEFKLTTIQETLHYNQLNKRILAGVKPVASIQADLLAQLGGGLHCLSFVN